MTVNKEFNIVHCLRFVNTLAVGCQFISSMAMVAVLTPSFLSISFSNIFQFYGLGRCEWLALVHVPTVDHVFVGLLLIILSLLFVLYTIQPDLSGQGYREVEYAARLLLEGGYDIDIVFTSRLKRAIRSVWILLQELNEVYIPVFKSWRLNERMYGALTGMSKSQTAEQLGSELVQEWRGSLRTRPPALTPGDEFWPGKERRYVMQYYSISLAYVCNSSGLPQPSP